jgi:hypothetical protein
MIMKMTQKTISGQVSKSQSNRTSSAQAIKTLLNEVLKERTDNNPYIFT